MAQKSSKSLMLPKFDKIDNWPQCEQVIRAIIEELLRSHEMVYRDLRDLYKEEIASQISVSIANYMTTEDIEANYSLTTAITTAITTNNEDYTPTDDLGDTYYTETEIDDNLADYKKTVDICAYIYANCLVVCT